MKHYMNLKQECFQKKLVRFDNKKKHKISPWLTAGTVGAKEIFTPYKSREHIYKSNV